MKESDVPEGRARRRNPPLFLLFLWSYKGAEKDNKK